MRLSELRSIIVAQVLATSRDHRGGIDDKWSYAPLAKDPVSAPDGTFRLGLATQPQRANDNTVDAYVVAFTLSTYHQGSAPESLDRIGDESERLQESLTAQNLIARNADVMHVELSPSGVNELTNLLASRFQLTVLYRQTASVVGA